MKISLIEPLGVPQSMIEELAKPIICRGHEFIAYDSKAKDIEELKERSKGQDIVIIANGKYPDEVVEACSGLKMIAVAFTGIDHVGLNACKKNNISVSNASGYSNTCVAEQTVGMAIAMYRHFKECDSAIREGKTSAGLIGIEIADKRVGIIGCGEIGTKVAKLFLAFGAEVVAYARHERDEVKKIGVKYVSLDELLKTSDIITLHVPNNASTKGMIGKNEIAKMKKSAIFINCARGPIVDNEELARALNEDRIKGAAIDVYDMEPPIPKSYPLLNAKNTLLTPHVAFLTEEAMVRRAKIVFDNVSSYLDGKPTNICSL